MNQAAASGPERRLGIIALGFATTVAIWIAMFVCRLPRYPIGNAYSAVMVPSWLLFLIIVGLLVAGGWLAVRLLGRRSDALWVGLVVGVINLLLVVGIISEPPPEKAPVVNEQLSAAPAGELLEPAYPEPSRLIWVPGSLIGTMALVGIGALLFRRREARPRPRIRFDWLLALSTFGAGLLTVMAGGLVTGAREGMAVYDWPNTANSMMFFYPLVSMTGGKYLEHGHRLAGSLTGLALLVLVVLMLWREERRGVRWLAISVLGLAAIQGVLGGFRVVWESLWLAMIHGAMGQTFLAMLLVLTVLLSERWRRSKPRVSTRASAERALGVTLVVLLLAQLLLGVIVRHWGLVDWALMLHVAVATIVLMVALLAGGRVWGYHGREPMFHWLGIGIMATVSAQMLIGFIALVAVAATQTDVSPHMFDIMFSTAHQTLGALLLVLAGVHVLLTYGRLEQAPVEAPAQAASGHATPLPEQQPVSAS